MIVVHCRQHRLLPEVFLAIGSVDASHLVSPLILKLEELFMISFQWDTIAGIYSMK